MKKHFFSLLAAALISSASAYAQNEIIVGDMNDDGQLTVGDVTELVETVAGRAPQRTISTKCDPDASNPAAIAGHWTVAEGTPLTLKADGTVASCADANVKTFEYYPYGRMLVLLDEGGNVVKDYLVVRKNKPLLVLQQLDGAYTTHNFVQLVESITLSETYLGMELGDEKRLSATVLPEDAKDRTFTWTSSDENVAEVSRTGLIYAAGDGICTITATANDASGVVATCTVVVFKEHEYVDLGLPSGTLWATCNVGADSPEEYGYYFAWGMTEIKDFVYSPNWEKVNYTDRNEDGTFKKYYVKGKTELDPEDDAAYVYWGENWRMPSSGQMNELLSNTIHSESSINGVRGDMFKSKSNANAIFLPYNEFNNGRGSYWTRDLYDDNYAHRYDSEFYSWGASGGNSRYWTFGVRPVRATPVSR